MAKTSSRISKDMTINHNIVIQTMETYFWIAKLYGRLLCPICGYIIGNRNAKDEEQKKQCYHTLRLEVQMTVETNKAISKDGIINITL